MPVIGLRETIDPSRESIGNSMQNPSLFVSGHDGRPNRTFIVEDYPEDESGQWATDEAIGEQGYIDDERSCFWTWDDNEQAWQSSQFKSREPKRRKGKGKGGFKGTGKAHFSQDPEWWSEEVRDWWSKGKKSRKGSSKGNDGIQNSGFRTNQPEKGTGNEFHLHKGRGKDQKRKGKAGACPQSGLSESETPSEEGSCHFWESDDWYFSLTDDSSTSAAGWSCTGHTAWMASVPLNPANHSTRVVLDLGCTRSTGSRAAIRRFQKHALYYGITTEFCRCNKSFVFAAVLSIFPTTPPCSAGVDVLETGNVPV